MAIQIDVVVVVIDRGDESPAFIPFVGMPIAPCFKLLHFRRCAGGGFRVHHIKYMRTLITSNVGYSSNSLAFDLQRGLTRRRLPQDPPSQSTSVIIQNISELKFLS